MPQHDFICPNCGADVPGGALSCPECGADEKTGWSEDTIYDATDIEDPDDFHHNDWQRREGLRGRRRSGREIGMWLVAVFMLLLFVFLLLR